MDFETLDQIQYLYDNEQLSKEDYKHMGKKFLFTTLLTRSMLPDESYFSQAIDFFEGEYDNDQIEIL